MYCSRCGSETSDSDTFCRRCGTSVGMPPAGVTTALLERPTGITLVAWLDILGGGFALLIALFMLSVGSARVTGISDEGPVIILMGCVFLAAGIAGLVTGIGLLKLKPYGRIMQIVLSCIGLVGFPIGTIASGLILYYMLKPGIELLFSGRQPAQFTPEELTKIAQAKQSAGLVVAVAVLLFVFVAIALVGIIAAISIPALLRARQMGNETQAISRLTAVMRAESAYAESNGGHYDTLACLVTPQRCLPGQAPEGVSAWATTDGPYTGTFYKGEAAPPAPGAVSPSSITSFAYVLVPTTPSAGSQVLCGDASGVIRTMPYAGAPPPAVPPLTSGACPESWLPLETGGVGSRL